MAAVKIVFALFVAACIFGFASAIFNLGNNDELGRKCGNETGASAEKVNDFLQSLSMFTLQDEKVDEKVKCFLKCVISFSTNYMTHDGKIRKGPFEEGDKRKKLELITDQCATVKGNNDCETAYLFVKCAKMEDEKLRKNRKPS